MYDVSGGVAIALHETLKLGSIELPTKAAATPRELIGQHQQLWIARLGIQARPIAFAWSFGLDDKQ